VLAVEAIALAVAIAIPAYLWLRSPPAIAFAQRDWVVLGDLNNLTREIVLDGSMESAFRLGLEQSRYVNVMSDLKVRDTLALMRRDPARTRVDRAVGSEVAIRDGARALIIPTVAEVGGHVRVTAEVIDPRTQATVYTESADGKGLNSVLPTIDAIDQRLRLRLGEALAQVSQTSKPLEQVTTANLDALRAYSLGQNAYFTGNMKDALAFYKDAVRLDPQFATAHLVIARVYLNAHNYAEVLKELSAAENTPSRLSNKDKLFIQAWQTTFQDPAKSLDQWKVLTDLYPDYYLANGLYSYFAWFANQYTTAISAAKLNAAPQNASRSAGIYLLGILYLAQEEYADAVKQFQLAADAGITRNDYYALAYAAQRNFVRADALLNESKQSNIPSDDLDTQLVRVAIAADHGSLRLVDDSLAAVKDNATQQGELEQLRVRGIALALRSQIGGVTTADLVKYAEATLGFQVGNEIDRRQMRFQAMFTAYLLARAGESKSAGRIMAMPGAAAIGQDDVLLKNMRLIVTAELLRAEKQPEHAVNKLEPLIDGHELYVTHLALLDAYADKGDLTQALNEAQWLSSHRGRAYAEFGGEQFMMAFNIVQSDLALLRTAELQQRLGRAKESAQALTAFNNAWPEAEEIKSVRTKLDTLHRAAQK
jgi:putative peptide modification system cyclase